MDNTAQHTYSRAQFSIDAQTWPRIAQVPDGTWTAWRARAAEAKFAAAAAKAELILSGDDADLTIVEDSLFARIAAGGWLGLAEGYMAGEWESDNLAVVLEKLIRAGYNPRIPRRLAADISDSYTGMELPPQLIRLFSGDGMSASGTVFSSGVPTTERIAVKNYAATAKTTQVTKVRQPAQRYIDDTTLTDPTYVEKQDLSGAQLHNIAMLLDAAHVRQGSHILDFPSSGGSLAIMAARRKAIVDAISSDADFVQDIRSVIHAAKVSDNVHIELSDSPLVDPREWSVDYDVISCVEKLEHMDQRTKREYIRKIDRLLNHSGIFVSQTIVSREKSRTKAEAALSLGKAYLWSAQEFSDLDSLRKLFDTHSNLRVISQTHIANHYAHGLALQRQMFQSQERQAAADGFDAVYRRMWVYYLSMKEALIHSGLLDVVQLVAVRPSRRRNV
ncbi:SAM-dependent methyltransferase [Corynebacterium sp. sy017]|uniref:class I SAM-dependent methyltransferase n=1 Tax=unclassified Corynebacterium TaxID=2624378 RepID=UPI00118544AF|nr:MULTISPECIES: class I SAM-dependent methyltransferase [unclassified Corynebacterium]MBP3087585.1 SAM-dependent methyltransferase [Corynebacterium sp. sy017]TSD92159.1 SAM-dependent methyltransferase [Corynebacterium sp. SY003]